MANKYVTYVLDFFKKEYDAVSGMLNAREAIKAVLTGLMSGGTFLTVLAAVQGSLSTIITDPNALKTVQTLITEISAKQWPLVVVTVGGIILEGVRRYYQGDPAVIVPVPAPDVKKKN